MDVYPSVPGAPAAPRCHRIDAYWVRRNWASLVEGRVVSLAEEADFGDTTTATSGNRISDQDSAYEEAVPEAPAGELMADVPTPRLYGRLGISATSLPLPTAVGASDALLRAA